MTKDTRLPCVPDSVLMSRGGRCDEDGPDLIGTGRTPCISPATEPAPGRPPAAPFRHSLRPAFLIGVIIAISAFQGVLAAALNLQTPLDAFDLDASQFREWDGTQEKAVFGGHHPSWVIWTRQSTPGGTSGTPGNTGVNYGYSPTPGWRHLRVAFTRSVPVGSVLVRGGGKLSVLKPDAPYPGDLADDSLWIPAERVGSGSVTADEVGDWKYAVWVLPPGTSTRALRFSHFSPATDPIFVGYLAGVYVLAERVVNLAPQAVVIASARPELGGLVNDEHGNHGYNGLSLWENGQTGTPLQSGGAKVISEQNPEWLILNWPRETTLSGVAFRGQEQSGSGFARAKVQRLVGPEASRPREAPESSWETILEVTGDPLSPQLNVAEFDWWSFPNEVKTRALRLLITQAADTTPSDPGKVELIKSGKRTWIEEWVALAPLGNQPTAAAIVPADPLKPPPIPITFQLEKPGVVTLVIEDSAGRRVRNLVSETPFPAGANTVWWDGFDDRGIYGFDPAKRLIFDPDGLSSLPGTYGVNKVRPRLVEPGTYSVRGLVRDPLDLVYEFSVNSTGNPPWTTFGRNGEPYRYFLNLGRYFTPEFARMVDRSFGWLADHTPPSDALFLPGNEPRVLLSSYAAEAGEGLAWVTLEGRKTNGQRTVGGFWNETGFVEGSPYLGAGFLARDTGPQAVFGVDAYAGSSFDQGISFHRLGPTGTLSRVLHYPLPNATEQDLGGLAVYNGRIVASLHPQNQLLFVNASDGTVLGTESLEDPRGLAFDASGRLLAISGNRIVRLTVPPGSTTIAATEVIASDLDDPQRVALDSSGNLYVSLHGNSHQVQVLTGDGRSLRTIGISGVPAVGRYRQEKMHRPLGLTVTSDNRLWVAENDYAPKRISVWTLDGQFVRAFYGPPQYGGGGEIDPLDRTRFYYYDRGGMEFRIDWENGTSELVNIYHRAAPEDLRLPLEEHSWFRGPQTPIHLNGHHYMVADNENPAGGSRAVSIWQMKDGRTYPVAALSVVRTFAGQPDAFWPILTNEPFASLAPEPPGFVAWSDLNENHQVETDELQFNREAPGSLSINERLEITTSNFKLFKPVRFTPTGVPVYGLATSQTLLSNPPDDPRYTAEETIHAPDSWTIKAANGSLRGVRDDQLVWTYPNEWANLEAVVSNPTPTATRPGEIFGTMRMLGDPVTPSLGEAGGLFGVYGYFGNIYLFTTDGLFLSTLFRDERESVAWMMPSLPRGTSVNDISLRDEAFWPGMAKTSDGRIYLTVGKEHSSIVRLDGLESVKRITPWTIDISSNLLAQAARFHEEREAVRQRQAGRDTLVVDFKPTPPVVDGEIGEWQDVGWVRISPTAQAALRIAGGRLFAALQIENPEVLRNTGDPEAHLFATGGGIDVLMGTARETDLERTAPVAGDLRLFLAQHHGVPKAMLYQPVAPDSRQGHDFKSSWRTVHFDRVQNVSDQLEFRRNGPNCEWSLPLSVLGWSPKPGQVLLGDLGIVHGRNGVVARREYWNNKTESAVSDVAGEALLTPHRWGLWRVPESDFDGTAAGNLTPVLPVIPELVAAEGVPVQVEFSRPFGLWHQLIPNIYGIPDPSGPGGFLPQTIATLLRNPFYLDFQGGAAVITGGFHLAGTVPPVTRYNHAQRLWGWIEPPASGDYVFWISAGGWDSVLYLSSDESPSTKRSIASSPSASPGAWTASTAQKSAPIKLEAGRRYYIEALSNEQQGPAHLSVGWQLPDGRLERPLPPHRLFLSPDASVPIDSDWPPQSLQYSVESDVASAIRIDPDLGVLTWVPSETDGARRVTIKVRVTDSGNPPLSAEQVFAVTVNEVNQPPILLPMGRQTALEGVPLNITTAAMDADLPPNTLSWSLSSGSPEGMRIDPATGAILWTPSEAQGPGEYSITLRVTDNGSPPLSAEQTIAIAVGDVNLPPVLAPVTAQSAREGIAFTLAPAASDPDVPANALRWSLAEGAPGGMTIDAGSGVLSWTPDEAHGGQSFPVTVTVTDDGVPALSATQTFTITVAEVNTAPKLAPITDLAVDELTELKFTATATDPDLPVQKLTFSLAPPLVPGASIDPVTGLFQFTPSEEQGPGVSTFTIRVNDDAVDRLVDRQTFSVTVREVNLAPKLEALADVKVPKGRPVSFTAAATDPDVPAQTLSFSLEPGAPAEATIDAGSGVFGWVPASSGTNTIVIRVADNGVPALSDTRSFTVAVTAEVMAPRITGFGLTAEGRFQMSWESEPGARYRIESTSTETVTGWTALPDEIVSDGPTATFSEAATTEAGRYFRIVRLE